jgi:DNA-binding response OmpR family regulator
VSDNGSGIPEQFRGQVFQKFAQADSSDTRKKGGTGLGLAITKSIVEQMGGSIGFDSEPDVQTTFFIEFPAWNEIAATNTTGKKRVLICEDDHDIAALLRMMLEQAGLATDIASNAAQAKEMLHTGEYAAMTLDLGLPDQNGIALIRELRANKETATLPIVVVSARASEGRMELNGEAFSVADWLTKPIDHDLLIASLKQAVKQSFGAYARVLHVEDDPDVVRVVQTIVGDLAEVVNAPTLADAHRLLGSNNYNLAILDISLPDGSGMELLPILNRATPPIPVMVFSAHEMALQDMQQVRSALVKSRADNEQLLTTIKKLLGVA